MEERLTLVGLNGKKEGAVLSPKQDLHASLTRGNAHVNGTQITTSTKLKLGDHIQIGEDKFILAPHNFKLDDNSLSVLAINGPNRGKRVLLDATKRIKHENDYAVLTPLHVQDDNTSHVEVTPTGRVSSQGKQLTRTTLMQHGHQLTIGTNTYIILPKNKTQTKTQNPTPNVKSTPPSLPKIKQTRPSQEKLTPKLTDEQLKIIQQTDFNKINKDGKLVASEIPSLVKKHFPKYNAREPDGEQELLNAQEFVRQIAKKIDANKKDGHGNTALHYVENHAAFDPLIGHSDGLNAWNTANKYGKYPFEVIFEEDFEPLHNYIKALHKNKVPFEKAQAIIRAETHEEKQTHKEHAIPEFDAFRSRLNTMHITFSGIGGALAKHAAKIMYLHLNKQLSKTYSKF